MMSKVKKPSKKIIALLIICLAIIASLLIITRKTLPIAAPALGYKIEDIQTYNSEHDNDQDSQELQNLLGNASSTDDSADASSTNTSDLVARSLYAGYLQLSQNNDTSDQSKIDLTQSIVSQAAQNFAYTQFSPGNMNIVSDPNQQSIQFFASSLASIQEEILAGMVSESQKPGAINLSNISNIYTKAAQDVYNLPTPVDLSSTALDIANNYNITAAFYMDLYNEKKDPVTVEIAIKYFETAAANQTSDLNAIADYLKQSGIIFSPDEIGNYWSNFGTGSINDIPATNNTSENSDTSSLDSEQSQ